jgi:hypothetical protein
MYFLIEYFEENNEVKTHIAGIADTKDDLDIIKKDILEAIIENNIDCFEIIASKNINAINSIKEILKNDNIKIFQTIQK